MEMRVLRACGHLFELLTTSRAQSRVRAFKTKSRIFVLTARVEWDNVGIASKLFAIHA